jgi:hypothetical protein
MNDYKKKKRNYLKINLFENIFFFFKFKKKKKELWLV